MNPTSSFATAFFTLFLSVHLYADNVRTFEIKPFVHSLSSQEQINSGLKMLKLENNQDALMQADQFQKNIEQIMNSEIQKNNGQMSYSVTEKKVSVITGLSALRELTVRFKSLVQRDGEDSSNTVVARIYIPYIYQRNCDYKFPASIFLHHILNEVEVIEKASQMMATGLLNEQAVFAVIHMPYYGERTDKSEKQKQFLTPNLNEFQKNMAQLILDTHVLKNILESLPEVDAQRINLSGISLGGVLGITVGAFDQSYNSYSFIVGGANVANILINRAETRKDSEVAIALKDLTETPDQVRLKLSAIDGYTWLHKYNGKKIQIVSASRDDIVDYNKSVKPVVEELKISNQVAHQLNDDTHSPSGSVWSKYKNVFKPMINFIVGDGQTLRQACPSTGDGIN